MTYTDGKAFFTAKSNCFPRDHLEEISELLSRASEEQLIELNKKIKSPVAMTLIALFFGNFGIDRFILGDTLIGVIKLVTCGGFNVLTLYDACTIASRVRDSNFQAILSLDIV